MPLKDDLDAELAGCLGDGLAPGLIARKVYGFRASPVLQSQSKIAFDVLNAVADRFTVPFRAVVVVGSAHTGYSYWKKRDFEAKVSDLDLAIVDTRLFCRYSELAFTATAGYTDLTKFADTNQAQAFRSYLLKGIFRPDKMPNCAARTDWFAFFNRLTMKHSVLFQSVNCGIYQSDLFFESKLTNLVSEYKKSQT